MKTFTMRSMPSRLLAFGGFVLLMGVGTGAFGAAGGSGTVNTVAGVTVGDRSISIAADQAESTRAELVRAYATFATGTSGNHTMGVAEREALGEEDSGTDVVSPGGFNLDDVSATVVDASAHVDVTGSYVRSVADGHLGSVSAFGGLITFDGLRTTSTTEVGDTQASASRAVSVDGAQIVDLGVLMGVLGVDPYALTCEGLEAAGEALNVDAGGTCAALDAARTAMADAASTLTDAVPALQQITDGFSESDVQADRDAAADPSATLLQLLTIAAQYPQITLQNAADFATTRTDLLSGLDEFLAAFDDLDLAQQADLGSQCGTASAEIAEVTGALSSLDPAGIRAPLSGAAAQIDDSCAVVARALDAVVDTPLMRLQGVDITMTSTAAPNDPSSIAAVEIASVSVGLNEGVTVSADNAEAVADAAIVVLTEAINGLLGPLGEQIDPPSLDLLTLESHTGVREDGYWFADSSLTLLRLELPSQTLTVPTGPDRALDLIEGVSALAAGMRSPARAAGGSDDDGGSVQAQGAGVPATSPDVTVAAGVFDTSSAFNPSARWAGQPEDPEGPGDGGDGDGGDGGGGDSGGGDGGGDGGDGDGGGDDGDGVSGPGGNASAGGSIGRRVIGDPAPLPRTGAPDRSQILLGLLLLAMAAGVKRVALSNP